MNRIETEEEYREALREVSQYFINEPILGSPDSVRFDILVDRITEYEVRMHPEILEDYKID